MPGLLEQIHLEPTAAKSEERNKGFSDSAEHLPSEWAKIVVLMYSDEGGRQAASWPIASSLFSLCILLTPSLMMFPCRIREYFSLYTTIPGIVLNLEFR